jgi:hypothetical protein
MSCARTSPGGFKVMGEIGLQNDGISPSEAISDGIIAAGVTNGTD